MSDSSGQRGRVVGRYALYDEIAAGGMATVHLGRLLGPVGFARTVAIKRLHPQFAKDPEFVAMFLDEARLAARIRHPNVVATLDVVAAEGELLVVMEYVQGESLARLLRSSRKGGAAVPPRIAVTILAGALAGLHAAHDATNERGEPLNLVHRDVSPQNIIVGLDGVPRVLDFGVAKAAGRLQVTQEGQLKGKPAYMAPEQLKGRGVDRRTDVYAAAVVLWETLTARRLFSGDSSAEVIQKVLNDGVSAPSRVDPSLPHELDEIVMRGLSRDPVFRFPTANDMAIALEHLGPLASPREIGSWVASIAGDTLNERAELVSQIESFPTDPDEPKTTVQPARSRREGQGSESQVSSISVSSANQLPAAGPRSKILVVAGIAALLVVVGVGAWALGARSSGKDSGTQPGSESRSGEGASRRGNDEQGDRAPATPASATSSPTTSAAPSVASSVASSAPSTTQPAVPLAKIKPGKVPPTKKPDCNPPYTVGPDGIHMPRPECE
jgi:serine/threonine protein kinase